MKNNRYLWRGRLFFYGFNDFKQNDQCNNLQNLIHNTTSLQGVWSTVFNIFCRITRIFIVTYNFHLVKPKRYI